MKFKQLYAFDCTCVVNINHMAKYTLHKLLHLNEIINHKNIKSNEKIKNNNLYEPLVLLLNK